MINLIKIFCSNPLLQYQAHQKDINQAVLKVMQKGKYILGEEVDAFEKEFAGYLGVREAVGVGSGTEALHLALKACGVGEGDEVITVSHTAVATVAAIELCRAKPVLVDIEPDYYTIDPNRIKQAISIRTKAIIPVHLYGQAVQMTPILNMAREKGIRIIEDCCQAHGAVYKNKKVGSLGHISCFSFYPTKNLGALGDGGMITTDNEKLAHKCRLLRQYGWAKRYLSYLAGWNSRLDELQAAILRIKLKYLDSDNQKRRRIAKIYNKGLINTGLVLPQERKNSTHAYHLYVVRCRQREQLRDFLTKKGIQTLIHYPLPIHLQLAYEGQLKIVGSLMQTERLAQEILSLPIYPELTVDEQNFVIKSVVSFYQK